MRCNEYTAALAIMEEMKDVGMTPSPSLSHSFLMASHHDAGTPGVTVVLHSLLDSDSSEFDRHGCLAAIKVLVPGTHSAGNLDELLQALRDQDRLDLVRLVKRAEFNDSRKASAGFSQDELHTERRKSWRNVMEHLYSTTKEDTNTTNKGSSWWVVE